MAISKKSLHLFFQRLKLELISNFDFIVSNVAIIKCHLGAEGPKEFFEKDFMKILEDLQENTFS